MGFSRRGTNLSSPRHGGSTFQKLGKLVRGRPGPQKTFRERLKAEGHFQCAGEAAPGELLEADI